ncbi:hypothetical protein EXIGLDRAFT_837028 [Exidia glandulosa HHB12029]|uniref:Uncharacterized protein n=1 Tax=Exidia glandulosa HHB12029 TaxID=1314781 RepID=A0A166AG31_EXIGL|nr:hypothetical protein EXIGLDRAFT_837028 [Exidia glandulosa HHB12029]
MQRRNMAFIVRPPAAQPQPSYQPGYGQPAYGQGGYATYTGYPQGPPPQGSPYVPPYGAPPGGYDPKDEPNVGQGMPQAPSPTYGGPGQPRQSGAGYNVDVYTIAVVSPSGGPETNGPPPIYAPPPGPPPNK